MANATLNFLIYIPINFLQDNLKMIIYVCMNQTFLVFQSRKWLNKRWWNTIFIFIFTEKFGHICYSWFYNAGFLTSKQSRDQNKSHWRNEKNLPWEKRKTKRGKGTYLWFVNSNIEPVNAEKRLRKTSLLY